MRIYLLIFFVASHPKAIRRETLSPGPLNWGGVSPVARLRGSALLES